MVNTKIVDYLNKNSNCINHPNTNAVFYSPDLKWLCSACRDKLKKEEENARR